MGRELDKGKQHVTLTQADWDNFTELALWIFTNDNELQCENGINCEVKRGVKGENLSV